jgi:hypothetical protein
MGALGYKKRQQVNAKCLFLNYNGEAFTSTGILTRTVVLMS